MLTLNELRVFILIPNLATLDTLGFSQEIPSITCSIYIKDAVA